jgi:hypothetical protein
VAEQQRAGIVEGDQARVEIVEVWPPAHESDDVAAFQLVLTGEKSGTRDDSHRKTPFAEAGLGIDRFFNVDCALHANPSASPVVNIVLAPFEEIMIALTPRDDAVVVADIAQNRIELAAIRCDSGCEDNLAKCHTIESVIADNEFFRPIWPANQRISLILDATQHSGDKIDPLRNCALAARLGDQTFDAGFGCAN